MKTIEWKDNTLILLDQTKLPTVEEYITCQEYKRVCTAIKRLEVRGAPAIGAAAAYGLLLGANELAATTHDLAAFKQQLAVIKQELALTRPTAVNLCWALEKMTANLDDCQDIPNLLQKLDTTATAIFAEDVDANRQIGEYGAKLIQPDTNILTHCNAGALATCGIGTALGVIRVAHEQGKIKMVYADETRPLLQGARLTSYELQADNIPVTVITDNMAGWVMKQGRIDAIVVGADRIAANGDTANKIGTYSLSVLAKEHNIPMYIAAPLSTFDFELHSGADIPIEERDAAEIRHLHGVPTTRPDVHVYNPAFDVTPAEYITAIITEYGVIHRPNSKNMLEFKNNLNK